MRNFNSWLRRSKACVKKVFPGAKPMQFNHCVRWKNFDIMQQQYMSESMTFYNQRVKMNLKVTR